MMPHIIYLLLIASSPAYIRGDETGSWGSLSSGPSESECRPYIEKALQGATIQEVAEHPSGSEDTEDKGLREKNDASEVSETFSSESSSDARGKEEVQIDSIETTETETKEESTNEILVDKDKSSEEVNEESKEYEESNTENSSPKESEEPLAEAHSEEIEIPPESVVDVGVVEKESFDAISGEETAEVTESTEDAALEQEESVEDTYEKDISSGKSEEAVLTEEETSIEEVESENTLPATEGGTVSTEFEEDTAEQKSEEVESAEQSLGIVNEPRKIDEEPVQSETSDEPSEESDKRSEPTELIEEKIEPTSEEATEEDLKIPHVSGESIEQLENQTEESSKEEKSHVEEGATEDTKEINKSEEGDSVETPDTPTEDQHQSIESAESPDAEMKEEVDPTHKGTEGEREEAQNVSSEGEGSTESAAPEEDLSMAIEVPANLRSREHMAQILRLSEEDEETEKLLSKTIENTLRDLKKLYDAAIKPLEILYKYRDLSNRHFGDPEIFSKPLILFMGPWSGGKSTIINYLLENEYKNTALRSGAEPSPAYFNIVMWGEHEEVLDGTQLAADWTFSGLQKFGQGLLDRLRGLKLNHPLLQKVNIIEIPGILEIRKQVERLFPFNDACQWFIDRADIIFLVYDPSKLDVGPETEAILDQLKGREMQTRIILNKADQVKPEELMRVQGTLIWNISPLMSSTEPPVMYSTSLWSLPYESGAPARLLYAQEIAFLKDLRDAIDKRVENKIASARRFAVRVRNHAKMVDCYLTTYYNHKSFFGNKKKISDDIIEHPQNYHIYEGLSTLTNISRYDLPDPDVYRDFFRLNPVYEFQQLASTCTYFRGCPINRLDVAIAYDLPELVGRYKKQAEEILNSIKK